MNNDSKAKPVFTRTVVLLKGKPLKDLIVSFEICCLNHGGKTLVPMTLGVGADANEVKAFKQTRKTVECRIKNEFLKRVVIKLIVPGSGFVISCLRCE